ncbi:MAG TPA: tripartite tricarboxylate transporter substrate-binding protein [Ramlibacter sp.]|nr:tripartite tricarboxylate transporter substrate-binding protein [Ramlibacter sp.]
MQAFVPYACRQKRLLRLAMPALLACALPGAAWSQAADFPTHAVKIAVPSLAGGGLDAMARAVATKLAEIWKQPVVVENRPDTRFIIAASYVAKSKPDGHTLLYSNISIPAINPAIFRSLPYKPSDFAAVAQVSSQPVGLFVNAALPVRSTAELITLLRQQPGKLNNGSGGPSGLMHAALFKQLTKTEFIDINYKGSAASMMSLASGETQIGFGDMASAGPLLKTGRIRQLAIGSPKRSALLPDVPTLAESGVPSYAASSWTGLFAPTGTSPEVIRKINADVQKVLAMPDVQQWFRSAEIEIQGGTPEEFEQAVTDARNTWGKLARERGIAFD